MPLSGKEMLRLYLLKGWEIVRIKGSHYVLRKEKRTQVIPVHGNNDLKKGLEQKLLKALSEDK